MKKFLSYITVPGLLLLAVSCRTDVIGGSINETNEFDMTTYEWLLENETTTVVAQLFEKAGLKDAINGEVTLISPSKYSVNRYVRRRNYGFRNGEEGAKEFKIEDLTEKELAQMAMYIYPGKWGRNDIPAEGVYLTSVDGSQEILLTLDETNTDPGSAYDGGNAAGAGFQYSNFLLTTPKLIHVLFKRGANWELTYLERATLTPDNDECDQSYRMMVSDVHTNTGVVHILYCGDSSYNEHFYYHSLFFYGKHTDDK